MFALLTLIQVNNLLFIMLFTFSMVLYRKYCQYNVGKKRLKVTKKLIFILVTRNEKWAKYLLGRKSSYTTTSQKKVMPNNSRPSCDEAFASFLSGLRHWWPPRRHRRRRRRGRRLRQPLPYSILSDFFFNDASSYITGYRKKCLNSMTIQQ